MGPDPAFTLNLNRPKPFWHEQVFPKLRTIAQIPVS